MISKTIGFRGLHNIFRHTHINSPCICGVGIEVTLWRPTAAPRNQLVFNLGELYASVWFLDSWLTTWASWMNFAWCCWWMIITGEESLSIHFYFYIYFYRVDCRMLKISINVRQWIFGLRKPSSSGSFHFLDVDANGLISESGPWENLRLSLVPAEYIHLQHGWVSVVNMKSGFSNMGLSWPMVLLIIMPIKWLFHWEYTLFSDKPVCEFVTIQQIGCHIAVWQQLRPEFASLFRLCDSLKQLQPADQVDHLLWLIFLVMSHDSFPYLSICFLLVTQRVVWFYSIDIVRVGARSRPQHSNAQWGVLAWKPCFNGSIWRKNEWTPQKYVNEGLLVWTSQFSLKILKPKLGLSDGYPGTPHFFATIFIFLGYTDTHPIPGIVYDGSLLNRRWYKQSLNSMLLSFCLFASFVFMLSEKGSRKRKCQFDEYLCIYNRCEVLEWC